jgi:hypothetical protein
MNFACCPFQVLQGSDSSAIFAMLMIQFSIRATSSAVSGALPGGGMIFPLIPNGLQTQWTKQVEELKRMVNEEKDC